jgi:hypothetical protein
LIIFNRFTQGLSLFSWVELKCVGRDYHHSLDSCCPLLRQRALKETETPCVACRDNITQTVFACFYRAKKYIRQVTGENHDEKQRACTMMSLFFRRACRIDYNKNNNQTNQMMSFNYTMHGGSLMCLIVVLVGLPCRRSIVRYSTIWLAGRAH